MKRQGDRIALALELVKHLQPGWSPSYMANGGNEVRRQLGLKEQEVYDAALAVLAKAMKSEGK